jgi:hypothetical protein
MSYFFTYFIILVIKKKSKIPNNFFPNNNHVTELKVVLDSIQTDLKNLKQKLSELDPTIQKEVS